MYNPQTKGTKDYTESIDEFRGLDLNERISAGFLAWTRNCSSRRYPTLSARLERGYVGDYAIESMIALDGDLYYASSSELWRLGDETPLMNLMGAVPKKSMVAMGTYILIFPEGAYFNTAYPSDCGYIDGGADFYASTTVDYTMCNSQGDGITAKAAPKDPYTYTPGDPGYSDYYDSHAHDDGYYWIDTGGSPHVLKRWSTTYQSWTQIPNTFTKIETAGVGASFNEMDTVLIDFSSVIPEGYYTIYHKDTDYIVVPYLLDEIQQGVSDPLVVGIRVPLMDYVVECNNRLWGCSDATNEIYACALGDFKNWYRFLGLSTDSYVASRGCDGPWTGAVSYLDTVVFFKENHIEVVRPSNTGAHQIETYHVNGTGVAPGSEKSVVVVDNVVYYHGVTGFYAYTGNLPRKISNQLGEHLYYGAVGGDLAGRYYVGVHDSPDVDSDAHLFVYDAEKNLWYREDDTPIKWFCRNGNELYFAAKDKEVDHDIVNELYTVRGTEGTKSPVEWMAVTHDFAYSHIENKNAKRVYVRANVTAGRKMKVYISYDSSYVWEDVGKIVGDGVHKYVDFPIVPARCDHYRLKFECNGDGCIWSVVTRFDDND